MQLTSDDCREAVALRVFLLVTPLWPIHHLMEGNPDFKIHVPKGDYLNYDVLEVLHKEEYQRGELSFRAYNK